MYFKHTSMVYKQIWRVINSLIGRTHDKSTISNTFNIDNKTVTDQQQILTFSLILEYNMQLKYLTPSFLIITLWKIKILLIC